MKTKNKKNNRRFYLVAAAAAALLLVTGGAWYWHRHNAAKTMPVSTDTGIRPSGSIDYSPAKPGENVANNARKGSSVSSSTIPQSTPSSSGGQTTASISIAGANKTPGTTDSITVSATLQNVSSGTCTFNFAHTAGGQVLQSYSEPVQYTGTYYSCPSHPVQMPSPSNGNWYVSATVVSGSQSATDKWPYAVTL